MEKPAVNEFPIHELLRQRWSPRAFARRPVPPDAMRSLLEAARWAASASNEQPWRFLIATQEEPTAFQRMADCLLPGNQAWAQHAPVLILTVAKRHFSHNDNENRHAFHDVGQATANLFIQAVELGLVAHAMAGFEPDRARAEFGIPEEYEPVAMIAVGYPGDPETLSEKLRERELLPRTRKPLREFVFTGQWGNPAPVLNEE